MGLQFLTSLQPPVGKPAMPVKRRLEGSERIVPVRRGGRGGSANRMLAYQWVGRGG
ncbi:MAG: hypothetical protein RLZZ172_1095 [Bacteroidota bacterium]|jgi:hypothetical protein